MARRFESARLSQACERYMTRITAEGQATSSIRTAHYALLRFRKAVAVRQPRDPDPYLHLITPVVMDDYCFGENGIRRGISARGFNRYRSILNGLFEYGIAMRWCDTNPMQAIGRSRPDPDKSRLLLTAGELLALPDACATPIQRAACAVGMNTGLRAHDIANLRLFDVSLAGGVIQTEIRKTRKLDVKPITMELQAELERWLATYTQLMGLKEREELDDGWYLLPSYFIEPPRKGRPEAVRPIHLDPTKSLTNMHRLVHAPLAKLGYPTKGEGFHTLRRSSARVLFELLRDKGESRDHALMVVRDYLNHANTAMTEHYLGLSHERAIRDAILKDRPFLSRQAETEQNRVAETPIRRLREHG